MRKLLIFVVLLGFGLTTGLKAQQKESSNILDKLVWDDKMLNIMLDMRVDFETDLTGDSLTDATFKAQTFKLWLAGEIVPGVRYRVRQRLNKPTDPLREGYSSATDQAWLAFDIGKKWTITVGKQSVQFGTFEYDYNPADIYLPTMCFDDLDAYKTGINAAYTVADQTFNLQVINSDATQFADSTYENKALAVNVLWVGKLFDGVLNTRWAYGAFQHKKDNFLSWITAGTQLNIEKFTTELDYYYGTRYMDYSSIVEADDFGLRKVRDQSAALNLKYNFGKWKPSVKGIWNQRFDKDLDEKAYDSWGVEAVMEFYPFKGLLQDLRFHAMYSYMKTDYADAYSGISDKGQHRALVGTRWLFKVK